MEHLVKLKNLVKISPDSIAQLKRQNANLINSLVEKTYRLRELERHQEELGNHEGEQ